MRGSCSVFGTVLLLCVLALAAPLPAGADTAISWTPALAEEVDAIGRDQVHSGRTPGLAIGIIENGRIVYASGFGFSTLGPHAAMAPDTQFYAGGLTRQFTAAAILLLAQDGKLSLDDRVSKFVPEFRYNAPVTIAQLLTQTSGFPRFTFKDPTRPVKTADLIATLSSQTPAAAPGTVYANNPLNYLIAGLVVERAGGVPLSDYLEQHIFIPVVMNGTFMAGDSGIASSHATGYTRSYGPFAPAPVWSPAVLGGDAGLVTTIYDLAKWDLDMPILLRVDAVRTMFAGTAASGATHYGMGWVVDRRGGKDFVWYDGEISGYRASSALLPEQHVGVIVFSNADSYHGPATDSHEVAARILDAIAPPATARLDNAIVERAKEWLNRLATGNIERGQLTPAFSTYLTDDLVAHDNFAKLGPLLSIVPLSSTTESNGDTTYEFLVRYRRAQYHYKFELTPQGKIDGLTLTA